MVGHEDDPGSATELHNLVQIIYHWTSQILTNNTAGFAWGW